MSVNYNCPPWHMYFFRIRISTCTYVTRTWWNSTVEHMYMDKITIFSCMVYIFKGLRTYSTDSTIVTTEERRRINDCHHDHFPWLFQKLFERIIVWWKLLEWSENKSEGLQKIQLMSIAIVVLVFLISVDRLSRIIWIGCSNKKKKLY